MKRVRKYSSMLVGTVVLVAAVAPGGHVLAQPSVWEPANSSSTNCGVIASGLWQGVNLALGTHYSCSAQSTGATTAETSRRPNEEPGEPGANNDVILPSDETDQGTNTSDIQETHKAAARTGSYAALGDSVAAGAGLKPLKGADPACDVSSQSYPAVVASSLGRRYHNYACSGATAGDLVTEQHLSGTSRDIEPQLDRAFASGTPSLMTMTAGANDTYWAHFVRKCYVSTCGTGTDQAATSVALSVLRFKLEYALDRIARQSNGRPPEVLMTGYYRPLSSACADGRTQGHNAVTSSELRWLNEQTDALNQAIRNAASRHASFAAYVPVDFSRHDLCSAHSWVQGLQDEAPFHPTTRGQQEIAKAVLRHAS